MAGWGIMGTGGIATAMAGALREAGSAIVAVGSARPGAATEFAARFDIPVAVESHAAVAGVDGVDIVYVATTNDLHHSNVLAAVSGGKAVLCEKPFALNRRQAQEMVAAAGEGGVLLVEAMWMRFLPFLDVVDRLLTENTIGEVTHVEASFGFPAPADRERRWYNLEQGGGALLDLGIYPLTLAYHLLGPVGAFAALAHKAATGVDTDVGIVSHHGPATTSLSASLVTDMANEAIIGGSRGRLRIHAPFHHSSTITHGRGGELLATHDTSYAGHGFAYQIREMERCLEAGLTESPRHPLSDTLAIAEWMDAIRRQTGVVYPADGA